MSSNTIGYTTVMDVCVSWDKIKRVSNYRDKAGELILCRAFDLEPNLRSLFKFTEEEDVKQNPKFMVHARAMVDMMDCAVNFLGPDLEPLADDLKDLGKRHTALGVQPEDLPVMEKAIMYALEELLGNRLTREDRNSWQLVFQYLINHMRKGMK